MIYFQRTKLYHYTAQIYILVRRTQILPISARSSLRLTFKGMNTVTGLQPVVDFPLSHFLDASLAPTPVSWLVRHTFRFPLDRYRVFLGHGMSYIF